MLRFRDYYDLHRVLVGEKQMSSATVYYGRPYRQYFVRAVRTRSVPGFVLLTVSSLVPETLRCHQYPRLDWFLSTLNYVSGNRFKVERDTHHEYNYYLVSACCIGDVSPSLGLVQITRLVREHVYYAGAAELLA